MNHSYISRIGRSRLRGAIGLLVCSGALGVASSVAHGSVLGGAPKARAATVETVNTTMSMDVSKITANTISAEGQALSTKSGGIDGTVSMSTTLLNGAKSRSTFTVVNNPRSGGAGTLRGTGTGNYHVSGATSYFTGGITSLSGTGTFAHVKDLGISLVGVLNRRTYRFTSTIKGKFIK